MITTSLIRAFRLQTVKQIDPKMCSYLSSTALKTAFLEVVKNDTWCAFLFDCTATL